MMISIKNISRLACTTLFGSLLLLTPLHAAKVGKEAVDFSLPGSDGKTYKLSEAREQFVVLEWLNHDCPYVRKHYDSGNMQALQKRFVDQDVVWYSILSSKEGEQGYLTADEANELIKQKGAFPTAVLHDPSGEVGKAYGAKVTPEIVVINPEGVVVYHGGIDNKPTTAVADIATAENYLVKALEEAMAGVEVSVKRSRPYGCTIKY